MYMKTCYRVDVDDEGRDINEKANTDTIVKDLKNLIYHNNLNMINSTCFLITRGTEGNVGFKFSKLV
jgi:hypothetical protein